MTSCECMRAPPRGGKRVQPSQPLPLPLRQARCCACRRSADVGLGDIYHSFIQTANIQRSIFPISPGSPRPFVPTQGRPAFLASAQRQPPGQIATHRRRPPGLGVSICPLIGSVLPPTPPLSPLVPVCHRYAAASEPQFIARCRPSSLSLSLSANWRRVASPPV